MTFFIENDVRIAAVPVKDFRVLLYDGRKKSMGPNRCNGGFFETYHEGGQAFTLDGTITGELNWEKIEAELLV